MFWSVKESQWSVDHIARHGVTLREVREVVLERPYWVVSGREGATLVYGRTHVGRYLLVVAVEDSGAAFVVTAREMTASEKRTFLRKAR